MDTVTDTGSEPYVPLAALRSLHRIIADLNASRSLAGSLQAVVEGVVSGLGFDTAAVNLVRPDGALTVAAVWEVDEFGQPQDDINALLGQVGSRESWERLLNVGDRYGSLVFVPHDRAWARAADLPTWSRDTAEPLDESCWHGDDQLFAPMYSVGRELLGVLSVDRPRNGRRPDPWTREALEMFAQQAGIAIGNARLRAEMQRSLIRLEREHQAVLASEESYRQAFEYAPSGMAITELHGDQRGRLTRVNDALCRLLGRSRSALRQHTFHDLVHPEDQRLLRGIATENGRAELRLARRDGGWIWVHLRNSVVADAVDGAHFLLTHVEDIEDRKRHELQLAHRASHDALTGLPNAAELRARLRLRLCDLPARPAFAPVAGAGAPAVGGAVGAVPAGALAGGAGSAAALPGPLPHQAAEPTSGFAAGRSAAELAPAPARLSAPGEDATMLLGELAANVRALDGCTTAARAANGRAAVPAPAAAGALAHAYAAGPGHEDHRAAGAVAAEHPAGGARGPYAGLPGLPGHAGLPGHSGHPAPGQPLPTTLSPALAPPQAPLAAARFTAPPYGPPQYAPQHAAPRPPGQPGAPGGHGGPGGRHAGPRPGEGAFAPGGHGHPSYEHVCAVPPDETGPGRRTGRGLAVLFCDLDGFKGINDRHGHNAGDAVLIEVARRLQQAVREGDTVARLGGDEFVVLADGLDPEQAKELAARLRLAVAPPVHWEHRTLRVGVSLGIGWAACGMGIDEVLHTADELMYVEKRARSGGRSHRRAG